jgi:hypothetical protein
MPILSELLWLADVSTTKRIQLYAMWVFIYRVIDKRVHVVKHLLEAEEIASSSSSCLDRQKFYVAADPTEWLVL